MSKAKVKSPKDQYIEKVRAAMSLDNMNARTW